MTEQKTITQITEKIDGSRETERQLVFMEKAAGYVQELSNELGRKPTCCVVTFGCQMNARDSEKLSGILEKVGYELVEREEADFVIYNTCTVRDNANQRVYGRLGYLNGLKKKNPHMLIALCGKKRMGIGGADIKLSTAAALLLGFYKGVIGFMLGLLIAVVAQLIITHRKKEQRTQPFALLPYLSVGLWIGYLI